MTSADLTARGLECPAPETVHIGPEVGHDALAPGTVLHPGCRISGPSTSVGPGCVLGEEGPVTMRDCQVGREVTLKGGFLDGAVVWDGATVGSCCHLRPGTLVEEGVITGHADGFKQTILFPFVNVGSLVNLCDCLVGGGTSPDNPSEIGSGFVHFNYTPNHDKATASLVGDVPRGVLLDQPPVFLGGLGGLVGPARVAFGTVSAAGTILRRDIDTPSHLVASGARTDDYQRPFETGRYGNPERLVENNLTYLGNIHALKRWYQHVRLAMAGTDRFAAACAAGGLRAIDTIIADRLMWFDVLLEKLGETAEPFASRIAAVRDRAPRGEDESGQPPEPVLHALAAARGAGYSATTYTDWVRALDARARVSATAWLESAVALRATPPPSSA